MVIGKLQRRHAAVVALYAALAVAAAGVPVVASSAVSEARTVTGDATGLSVADINGSRTGRIKVIEPKGQGAVVPGVRYTLERISGIDLTTEAGWKRASELSDADAAAAPKDAGITKVVDENGEAVFDGLPVGVYYVTESDPEGVPDGYRPTDPFVITLPVARKNPDGWRYEVAVYAKAQPGESTPPVTPPPSTVTTTTTPPVTTTTTTTTTPPVTTTTTTPVTTTTTPDKPSTTERIRKGLASTGANVLGLIAVGVGLLLLGGFLVARRRRSESGGE